MKKLIILAVALGMLAVPAAAENNKRTSTYEVVKSETSFFSSLWGKVKRIVPNKRAANTTTTAVLGVRGAETTESALKPHWEGDLSTDSAFRNDVKQFEDGTMLCESATPSKGTAAFEQLLKTSSNNMLKANTMIALASCYAQQGNEAKGKEHLQSFLLKYPEHPMHDEISTWLTAHK